VIGTAVGEAPAAAEVVDAGPWQALNVATAVHATSRERRLRTEMLMSSN
jgi:hypothetical protein